MAPLDQVSNLTPPTFSPGRRIANAGANPAARELEAAFLAEMLSHAGFEEALVRGSGFSGESMAGFLVAEISRRLAAQEIFGIADIIETTLKDRK
jgi:Rod binding domain-containing protein